jgi:hypothetical protein
MMMTMITRNMFAIDLCFPATNAPTHNNLAHMPGMYKQHSIPFLIHDLMSCLLMLVTVYPLHRYLGGSYRVLHSNVRTL